MIQRRSWTPRRKGDAEATRRGAKLSARSFNAPTSRRRARLTRTIPIVGRESRNDDCSYSTGPSVFSSSEAKSNMSHMTLVVWDAPITTPPLQQLARSLLVRFACAYPRRSYSPKRSVCETNAMLEWMATCRAS